MKDMINEFRDIMREGFGGSDDGSKTFLVEVGKRVKNQLGKMAPHLGTDVRPPHLITTVIAEKKEQYVTMQTIRVNSPLGNTLIINKPMTLSKTIPLPMMQVLSVFPNANGYVIQVEDRIGEEMMNPKNIKSFSMQKQYVEKDIKTVTDMIIKSVKTFIKNPTEK
jgi:hypothetical protein